MPIPDFMELKKGKITNDLYYGVKDEFALNIFDYDYQYLQWKQGCGAINRNGEMEYEKTKL